MRSTLVDPTSRRSHHRPHRAMASLSEELGRGGDAQRQTQLPASRNAGFAASITRRWPLAVMPLYGRRAILPESGRGVTVSSLTRVIADRPKLTNHSRSAWIQGGCRNATHEVHPSALSPRSRSSHSPLTGRLHRLHGPHMNGWHSLRSRLSKRSAIMNDYDPTRPAGQGYGDCCRTEEVDGSRPLR